MALREACSPVNITSASGAVEVFKKYVFGGAPGEEVVVILAVVAKPELPWGWAVVVEGGRARAERMVGSRCMFIV